MKKAIFFSVLFLLIGFAEGMLTNPETMLWYHSLNLPTLTPPDMLFPIAWSILYIMLGFAFSYALETKNQSLIITFGLNLLLNFAWTPLFFGLQNVFFALIVILLVDISTLILLYHAYNDSRKMYYLLLPYFVWVFFATYLNLYIYLNN